MSGFSGFVWTEGSKISRFVQRGGRKAPKYPDSCKGGQTLSDVSSLARTGRNNIIYFLEGISDFIFILLPSPP